MTVRDCMKEYREVGDKMFGSPRFFTSYRFGVVDRTIYKGSKSRKVFQEVAERRTEQMNEGQRRITIASERGLCRTSVPFFGFLGFFFSIPFSYQVECFRVPRSYMKKVIHFWDGLPD